MKTSTLVILNMLLLLGLNCFFMKNIYSQVNIPRERAKENIYGQAKQDSLNQSFKDWRHMNKYNSIIQQSIFTPLMSDDEMAGIELWRAGRNLKMAFSFELVGLGIASTASWLPQLIIGKKYKGNMSQQDVQLIIGGISGVFEIIALCELVSGYNKIGNAGIIFQHKKFQIKTKGNDISLNF